ncbi:hypothetical protein [Nesterenkonia pannonica]|nr:hypothetical protein [Nesterenkonia pannonica]
MNTHMRTASKFLGIGTIALLGLTACNDGAARMRPRRTRTPPRPMRT